jgi:hypothetical protein
VSIANDLERLMLELINAERTSLGLNAVTLELTLNESSENHSTWMLEEDIFSHTGVNGTRASDRMVDAGFTFSGSWAWGENVAWQSIRGPAGLEDDVADLHTALMNSPGHRANILSTNFDYIGIGIEVGNFNGWNAIMITQNFARTSASVQLDVENVPIPNVAPVATLGDSLIDLGKTETIGTAVNYQDADGDAAVRFEVRGSSAGFDLKLNGAAITPGTGYEISAAQISKLTATAVTAGAEASLQLRAFDGEDWGGWDNFLLKAPQQAPEISQHFVNFFAFRSSDELSAQADNDSPSTMSLNDYFGDDYVIVGADHFDIA